jgi:ribosome biogenesis GTPase
MSKAFVAYGINNLFSLVCEDGSLMDARIKGKKLKGVDDSEHNVITAGDEVTLDEQGQIIARLPRRSYIRRYNHKSYQVQTLASNISLGLVVVALNSPPLHPRFLDRLLIVCAEGGVLPHIVVNKADQLTKSDEEATIALYRSLGYPLTLCSSYTGEGINELKTLCKGEMVALVGASGVGKSSLLNLFVPQATQKIGELNKKFKRGNHTTNFAVALAQQEGGYFVDTPGIRTLTPVISKEDSLINYYPDMLPYVGCCLYANCSHINEEECAIKDAVANDLINAGRYDGFVKLSTEIKDSN